MEFNVETIKAIKITMEMTPGEVRQFVQVLRVGIEHMPGTAPEVVQQIVYGLDVE